MTAKEKAKLLKELMNSVDRRFALMKQEISLRERALLLAILNFVKPENEREK